MENLNKDPGPCSTWVWPRGFSYGGCAPSQPLLRRPLSLRSAHGERRQRQQPLCSLSEGCVPFHINDKDGRGSEKSLSYAHLFKKRQNSTIQSAGVRRNSVKAGGEGGRPFPPMTKGRNSLTFFLSLKQGQTRKISAGLHRNQGILHAFQWVGFPHKEKEQQQHRAVHLFLSPVVKPL